MNGYKHLLACAELESSDEVVLAAAKTVAGYYRANLTALTVVEPVSQLLTGMDTLRAADFTTQIQAGSRTALAALCRRNGLSANDAAVIVGRPGTDIAKFAMQRSVDLIVVGAHERHGLGHLIGSVALAVLHTADCDVLGVRLDKASTAHRRAAIAIDPAADPGTRSALLNRADTLSRHMEVCYVTVARSPHIDFAIDIEHMSRETAESIQHAQSSTVEKHLTQAGIQSDLVVLHGTPSKQIKRYAKDASVDLLVLGLGEKTAKGWKIGSTTNNVLHEAPCDTLVVRSARRRSEKQP